MRIFAGCAFDQDSFVSCNQVLDMCAQALTQGMFALDGAEPGPVRCHGVPHICYLPCSVICPLV